MKRLELLKKAREESNIKYERSDPLFTSTIFQDGASWPEVLRIPQLFTLTGGETERRVVTTGYVKFERSVQLNEAVKLRKVIREGSEEGMDF